MLYVIFLGSIVYLGGTLPCGRFYYENVDGFFGNAFLRLSYEYVYLYLGVLAHAIERLERSYAAGAAHSYYLQRHVRLALGIKGDWI